ncbi:MAG TPA: hypothetical protein VFK78_00620 [Gemmatimonadales bacterium]|nr:hypothetical protein [Gemmatimonadales bacterium]
MSDTRWTFDGGGACERQVITTTVSAGFSDTVSLACTYTFNGSTVQILFQGSSMPTPFSVSFQNGDLILGGFRFTRLG